MNIEFFAQIGFIGALWALAVGLMFGGAAGFGWWGWGDRRGRLCLFLGCGLGFLMLGLTVLFITNLPYRQE